MSKPAALSRLPSSVIPVPSHHLLPPSLPPVPAARCFPTNYRSVSSFAFTPRRNFDAKIGVAIHVRSPFLPRGKREESPRFVPRTHDDKITNEFSLFFFPVAESLVQELELERKSRQHQAAERDQVKSPLQGGFADSTSSPPRRPSISANKYLTWIESRCKNYADRFRANTLPPAEHSNTLDSNDQPNFRIFN